MADTDGTGGFDMLSAPNRQGYLILGSCFGPPISVPEPCLGTEGATSYDHLPCRCVRSRARMSSSPPVALRPHDEARRDLRIFCGEI